MDKSQRVAATGSAGPRSGRERILKRKRRMTDAAEKVSGPATKKAKTGPVGRPSRYLFRVRGRDLGNYKIWNMGKVAGGGGGRGMGSDGEDEMGDEDEEEESDSGAETDYAWDMFAG